MSSKSEVFTSRWGMLLAMLGMAVGTGNIWRFPRIAASNGGGSFLVAWAVFLLLWSVPLLILEFGMGKATRSGTIGSFVKMIGPGFACVGAWVAVTSLWHPKPGRSDHSGRVGTPNRRSTLSRWQLF